MRTTHDVEASNIIEGKRKRVMSTDAVKSFIAQEYTESLA